MSRLSQNLGERYMALLTLVLCVGSVSLMAAAVAFSLYWKREVGPLGAAGILLLGPLIGLALSVMVLRVTNAASRGLVKAVTGAGNIARAPGYSYQESLATRGKYAEAADAYRSHIADWPDDLDARMALAALSRDHLDDPAGAEHIYLEVRTLGPSARQEFAVGNALIDLYHATGQPGRELTELARFAGRFGDTEAGARAREALRRIKSGPGMTGWRYFGSRQVGDARRWAAGGGIAVHENIWKSRGRRTCHLLARDQASLLGAAREIGCADHWIQRTRTLHFDLVDIYLERALARCGVTSG